MNPLLYNKLSLNFLFIGQESIRINSAILIGGVVFLLSSFLYFWFYRILQLKNKEREQRIKFLQIQTLQSQLNPHFIFNVLSSIQSLVLNEKTELANKYLISFSKLIRSFLNSTVRSNATLDISSFELEVTLKEELELINLYIEFERLQYDNKFDFELNVDPSIEIDTFSIPPMIIQPFVENSIKHGLNYMEVRGVLKVKFYLKDNSLMCEIEDNGVGRNRAAQMQAETIRAYKPMGIDLVMQRVKILNTLDYDIRVYTEDLSPQGTRVNIFFNLKE